MSRIDFNCDLGEGCGADAAIIPFISSASIACGAHAGDENTMRTALRLCRDHDVAAGAHPGYADRDHFGRREIALSDEGIRALVESQLARLASIALEEGVKLSHVKPHGALYNLAARDRRVADGIAAAVARFDPTLILYGLSGSQLTAAGNAFGLNVAHEVFAERGYSDNGQLVPRDQHGAVLETLEESIAQARSLSMRQCVTTQSSQTIWLKADTLCLHGDRPDATAFARSLREALTRDGVEIRRVGETQ